MQFGAGDAGDAAMVAAFDEVIGPAAERFQPNIILVRAVPKNAHKWAKAPVTRSMIANVLGTAALQLRICLLTFNGVLLPGECRL